MTRGPLRLRTPDLPLPARLVRQFLDDPAGGSWVLHLPGHWGVEALLAAMRESVTPAVIDGLGGRPSSSTGASVPPAPDSHGRAGPVVVLWPRHLSEDVLDDVVSLGVSGRRRLLVVVRSPQDVPERLHELERTGQLRAVFPGTVSARELGVQVRRHLGGPVSLRVVRRLYHLSAGQQALAESLLDMARSAGTLREDEGFWEWAGDEEELHQTLSQAADSLLLGLEIDERELLTLVAIAGRIPEQHALDHYGEEPLASLVAQGLLGHETTAAGGWSDLRVTAEGVRLMILSEMRWADILRWWHDEGRGIDHTQGGDSSATALRWWRARAQQTPSLEEAADLARRGLAASWYRMVQVLTELYPRPSAELMVLAARADYALGDVDGALHRLASLPEAAGRAEIREGVLVAERIRLFHPERSLPVVESLRSRAGEGSPTSTFDAVLAMSDDPERTEELLAALQTLRASEDCEESLLSQLCAGTLLGTRHQSDLGREVLSTLIDVLRREDGFPDMEECAVAMLLLISATSGWRVDMLRVETDIWNERRLRSPALAGVGDLLAAFAAMQDDRMHLAFRSAASAARIHAVGDSYGLLGFSRALALAAASLMAQPPRMILPDPESPDSVHADSVHADSVHADSVHADPVHAGPERHEAGAADGIPWLRLAGEGLALCAAGLTEEELGRRLESLAQQAGDAGETAQEQLLLLMVLLRRSPQAARQVARARWRDDPGRPRLIRLFAEAQGTDDPVAAVDAAERLIGSHARLLGLAVLAKMWDRREDLDAGLRVRLLNLVLDSRRPGEESTMFREHFELTLTGREAPVFAGLRAGRTTAQIARDLHVSSRTVEATISGMLQRFGCGNRMELLSLHLRIEPFEAPVR
ncbi:LuxR C-terminal-related transcriptional regulator [Nesterenkonia sp. PF2B19]|uniref:LuxR C-terminal-related transcriptional regulator n=1 Tax=Nesterenkonia sp. PF2B19 TaxID=1881858 RepID=UPI000871D1AA|nr:LuxR C-terminal-related transcriptional regulator [Nesterenkonia sp. PF2B19]OSM42846.1 hypothetical protein BCY76_011965 [Nesterenkonia sp. PF2B19]